MTGAYLDRRAATSRMIELDVSIAGLAERIGVEQTDLRYLLYGSRPVETEVIARIAVALDVPATAISTDSAPPLEPSSLSLTERISQLETRVNAIERGCQS